MMSVPKWDWNISNGNASAEATAAAYTALTTGGRTADFTSAVWNDILAKVSAQRIAWTDTAWDVHGPSLADTQMNTGDAMTAVRFNAVVNNMPPIKSWPWQDSLGRTDIKPRDACKGNYFIGLTDGVNHWIDLVPIPFSYAGWHNSALIPDIHVLPAIHVIGENVFEWIYSARAHLNQSVPASFNLNVESQQTGCVSYLNIADIIISNFVQAIIRNKVSLYQASHVIGGLNVAAQYTGQISTDISALVMASLDAAFSGTTTMALDAYAHVKSDIIAGPLQMLSEIALTQHINTGCGMSFVLQGEPLILERESMPFASYLQSLSTASLNLSTTLQTTVPFGLSLIFQMTSLSQLDSCNAMRFAGNAASTSSGSGCVTNATPNHIDVEMQSTSSFNATLSSLGYTVPIAGSMQIVCDDTASAIIKHTDGFTANVSAGTSVSTTMSLLNYTLMYAALVYQHSCSADAKLMMTNHLDADMIMSHSVTTSINSVDSMPDASTINVTSTMSCSVSMLSITLVSDLEYVLVSDLDDILITDVEYSIV